MLAGGQRPCSRTLLTRLAVWLVALADVSAPSVVRHLAMAMGGGLITTMVITYYYHGYYYHGSLMQQPPQALPLFALPGLGSKTKGVRLTRPVLVRAGDIVAIRHTKWPLTELAMSLGKKYLVVTAPIDQWITDWVGSEDLVYLVDSTRLDQPSTHAKLLNGLHYKLVARSAKFGDSDFEFHEGVTKELLLATWAFRCSWEEAAVFEKSTREGRKKAGIRGLAKHLKEDEMKALRMKALMGPALPLALTWAAAAAMDTLEKDIEREMDMETTSKPGKKATDSVAQAAFSLFKGGP